MAEASPPRRPSLLRRVLRRRGDDPILVDKPDPRVLPTNGDDNEGDDAGGDTPTPDEGGSPAAPDEGGGEEGTPADGLVFEGDPGEGDRQRVVFTDQEAEVVTVNPAEARRRLDEVKNRCRQLHREATRNARSLQALCLSLGKLPGPNLLCGVGTLAQNLFADAAADCVADPPRSDIGVVTVFSATRFRPAPSDTPEQKAMQAYADATMSSSVAMHATVVSIERYAWAVQRYFRRGMVDSREAIQNQADAIQSNARASASQLLELRQAGVALNDVWPSLVASASGDPDARPSPQVAAAHLEATLEEFGGRYGHLLDRHGISRADVERRINPFAPIGKVLIPKESQLPNNAQWMSAISGLHDGFQGLANAFLAQSPQRAPRPRN